MGEAMATTTKVRRGPGREQSACCSPALLGSGLPDREAEDLAQTFAALADPVRLRCLSLIAAAGECCSCDLEGPLERSQPTVSHHTKALADVGLIVGEKRGRWMWWQVVPGRLAALQAALQLDSLRTDQ
jgi:ArsR family transcriptional regulator